MFKQRVDLIRMDIIREYLGRYFFRKYAEKLILKNAEEYIKKHRYPE